MIALAFDEDVSVTAGIGGFLVFFFLAIALWLLMRNMFKRIRRVRYREAARVEAEEAELERQRRLEEGEDSPGAESDGGADRPQGETPQRDGQRDEGPQAP